jgi:hypothetical protein
MTDYESAKRQRDSISAELTRLSVILESYPKGPMNLTPDSVKATPEHQQTRRECNTAFARLRAFNTVFIRTYKREITLDRANRRKE